MEPKVTVEGLSESLKAFRKLGKEFKQNDAKNPINKALMAAALPIQKESKARALAVDDPETEGRIADNIVRSRVKRPREMFEVGVMVRTNARGGKNNPKNSRHWHFTEFGTDKQPARAYMRRGGMAGTPKARQIFAKRLKAAVEKAAEIQGNLVNRAIRSQIR